jgi:DNA-binding MarR family transcriptional regulator
MAQAYAADRDRGRLRQPGVAYLLSVVGTASSQRWQERMRQLSLDPREVVVLRMVAADPGRTQRSLAPALHVRASHLVAVLDGLEERGLLERKPNPNDRRAHALYLTRRGHAVLDDVMRVSDEHEAELTDGLSATDRASLEELLARIAHRQGVAPGGHPGFDDGE